MNAEMLMQGPRGRRLLLEFATLSERISGPEYNEGSLVYAVMSAAHERDPGRGTSRKLVMIGNEEATFPVVPPEVVAQRIDRTELVDVTPDRLRLVLADSVESARYYQEPDGEDFLTATPPVRQAISRVASHVASSPLTDWWETECKTEDQAWIWWDNHTPDPSSYGPSAMARWREETIATNQRSLRERPEDPAANYSGIWWSTPAPRAFSTSRLLENDAPAGLWFTEDSGFDKAQSVQFRPPANATILEIRSADDWARLCRDYPLDVSAEKRHDWYRASGRVGRWVIPDWAAVAEQFSGVHLTVSAYLAASGVVIPIDADSASFIAGWSPDETWWFVNPSHSGEPRSWRFEHSWEGSEWVESV